MIWKERNRRIFEDKHRFVPQLASLMKEDLTLQLLILLPRAYADSS
jgi:hypothetical protein